VTCVIFPIKLPLPNKITRLLYRTFVVLRLCDYSEDPPERWHISLSLETAPFIGVILLLATTTIDGSVIRLGIAGEDGIRPYDVLALFIILVREFTPRPPPPLPMCLTLSKAYIATALDATGALRALAFWVAQKGGSSGPLLHFYLYCFFFVCGVIFGNVGPTAATASEQAG
jgi:hypothetical protein